MPGKVRTDLFDPDAARKLPQQRIPAWGALVAPRRFEASSGDDLAAAQEQMVEALRGLGYVDDRGGKPRATAEGAGTEAGHERPKAMYHRNLATWLMNENRFADAERELVAANAVEPMPKTFWMISEARAARGDLSGARQALEEAFVALPDSMDPSAVLWLVELDLRAGNPDQAEAVLAGRRELAQREPAVRMVAEGRIAEARGDGARARSLFLEALDRDPRQTRAAERIAALAATPAERAVLVPYLERGLALDERIELYWKMLGLIRLEGGDATGAATALRHAVELEPADEELAMTFATALMRSDRAADARTVYERMAAAGTRRAPAWVNLGSLRAEAGDWLGARAAWEQAIALGADSPQLRAGLAEARRRTGGSVERSRGRAVPSSAQPVAERDAGPERRRAPRVHGAAQAGARVPDRPRGPLAHDEGAEPRHRDPFAPVERVRDHAVLGVRAEQRLHDASRGGLRQARARREPLDQLLTVHRVPPGRFGAAPERCTATRGVAPARARAAR